MKTNLKSSIIVSVLLATLGSVHADSLSSNVSTFATGLNYPRGLKFGPDGNLYVAEAGAGGTMSTSGMCDQVVPPIGPYTGGFTARISKITPDGMRTTIADNLPSTIAAVGDVDGVADIAFIGDTLYALLAGGGCSHGFANVDNAVLLVNAIGTTTQIADLSAFQKANPVADPEKDDFEPDGTWYSMLAVGDALFAIEPNHGELDMITTAGVITRVADISASQGHIVPTTMVYDGNFYVGNLNTFPEQAGKSEILKITPTGAVSTFATGFTAILGLAFDSAHRLYVLESTTKDNDFPTPGTGKVVRVDNAGNITEIATGLSLPTGMTFGPDGNLYVSNWGFGPPNMGEIVKIDLQAATTPRLGNMSARGLVESGDNVLIGGIIINGGGTQKLLVRGMGPSMTALHVANALPDPVLTIYDVNGMRLATNNDWQDDTTQAALITKTGKAPSDPHESAIVTDLAPGAYTAIVTSKTSASGVALVEFYALDPITGLPR